MTIFDRLCSRACSITASATALLGSTAVVAPSSSASLTARRMRSRRFAGEALQCGRLDVDRVPRDCELLGEHRRAADHVLAAVVGADAAQDGRLGLPDAADRALDAVRLHVALDAIGGAAQRELAQRHQVALAEEVRRSALGLWAAVDLALA